MTPLERFKKHYIPVTESGCWLWVGATLRNGYGYFNGSTKSRLAHRVAYELYKGAIPIGLVIDHLCRVKCCVNPDHLEAVPQRTNLLRGNTTQRRYAGRTHCSQGHPYAGSNLILEKRGRYCRICKNEAVRRSYTRHIVKERSKSGTALS